MPNFARDDADMSVFNRSKKGRHKYAQSQQHYWIKRSQSQRRRLGHGGIARIVPRTHCRRRALAAVFDGRHYRVKIFRTGNPALSANSGVAAQYQ